MASELDTLAEKVVISQPQIVDGEKSANGERLTKAAGNILYVSAVANAK